MVIPMPGSSHLQGNGPANGAWILCSQLGATFKKTSRHSGKGKLKKCITELEGHNLVETAGCGGDYRVRYGQEAK